MPGLDDLSKRVLRLLLERKVVSGWEIASAVGQDKFKEAIEPLLSHGYVDFSGDLADAERMLKSYFNLKPSALSRAKSEFQT